MANMLKAFNLGRSAVTLLVVLAGFTVWAYQWCDNALNYTEVIARVQQVEELCHEKGQEHSQAAPCAFGGKKKLVHLRAARVRYKSPADSTEHEGTIYLRSGRNVDHAQLRAGDEWPIWAHDDNPILVKAK